VTFGGGRAGLAARIVLGRRASGIHRWGGQHEHRHPGTSRERTHRGGDSPRRAAIRAAPGNAALRQQLFQLLAILGQWSRAAQQISTAGSLDPKLTPTVLAYRGLAEAEIVRQAVFAGVTSPMIMGSRRVDGRLAQGRAVRHSRRVFPGRSVPRRGARLITCDPVHPHAAGGGGERQGGGARAACSTPTRAWRPMLEGSSTASTSGSHLATVGAGDPAARVPRGLCLGFRPIPLDGRRRVARVHPDALPQLRAERRRRYPPGPEDRVHRRRVRHEPRAWAPHAAHPAATRSRFSSLD